MRLPRGRRKRRVCVLGLDGVPFGLLTRLAQTGVMPHVAAMVKQAGLRQMRAPLPPVSSVSWSSFMTGANPGEHGIFGFTDVAPDTYRLRFPRFSDLATPTFWDRLGESGKRCCIINQPATYPARALPGALVSGFVAPDLARGVYPARHLAVLQRMGYRIDVAVDQARGDPHRLLDDLEATLDTRRRAALHFWEQEQWDYFQLVITGTDRLHHFLWNAVAQDDHPLHERAARYYQAVDSLIGELWGRFHQGGSLSREAEGFLLLSDHGFTAARREVRLNAWLHESGYLSYRTPDPASIADIAPGTRAFALDPGRIYINTKRRFAAGCVAAEEVGSLREELARRLRSLTDEGEPAVEHVFSREAIYRGPRSELGPDLVVIGKDGFDVKGTAKGADVFTGARFQGMHTCDDAFVWSLLPIPDDPEVSHLASPIVAWLSS